MRVWLAAVAVLAAALWIVSGSGAAPASTQRVEVPNGNLALPAIVARPAGNHRFPAVVLLHGCSGLWGKGDTTQPQRHIKRWIQQLQSRGFVAIAVDSFTPRGVKTVCGRDPSRTGVNEVTDRATDAFAALTYLRSLSYVSPQRIAVLGWSNGGSTALATVGAKAPVAPPAAGGFRAAVAFYPAAGCAARSSRTARQWRHAYWRPGATRSWPAARSARDTRASASS